VGSAAVLEKANMVFKTTSDIKLSTFKALETVDD